MSLKILMVDSNNMFNPVVAISSQIELPVIASKSKNPITFDCLKKLINDEDLSFIRRAPIDALSYRIFTAELSEKGMTVEDYITENFLGRGGKTGEKCYRLSDNFFIQIFSNDNRYKVFIQCDDEFLPKHAWLDEFINSNREKLTIAQTTDLKIDKDDRIVIARNRFHYDICDDIDQWLLWSSVDVRESCIQKLADYLFKGRRFAIHINPMDRRSVKGVFHAHLFVEKTKLCQ